jgi:hypothetical protein
MWSVDIQTAFIHIERNMGLPLRTEERKKLGMANQNMGIQLDLAIATPLRVFERGVICGLKSFDGLNVLVKLRKLSRLFGKSGVTADVVC